MLLTPGDLDAAAYALTLEETVLPGIMRGASGPNVRHGTDDKAEGLRLIERELTPFTSGRRAQALLEAAAPFAPPANLEGGREGHAILLGMIAFRAATSEFIRRYPDVRERHKRAASWVCENFREIFWWKCD